MFTNSTLGIFICGAIRVNLPFATSANSVCIPAFQGALVAQWVKRWPTDLVVPSLSPAEGEIFSTITGIPLHIAFHHQPLFVLI